MGLNHRIIKIKNQISDISAEQSGVSNYKSLNDKNTVLSKYIKDLESYEAKKVLIGQCGTTVNSNVSTDSIREALKRIVKRFKRNPSFQSLTYGNDWEIVSNEMKRLNSELNKILTDAWKNFVTSTYCGESLDILQSTLPKTEKNNALLDQFDNKYKSYIYHKNKFPDSDSDIDKVIKLAKELNDLIQQMDRDIPEDVKKFINAVNVKTGASLLLLTEGVKKWLIENDEVYSYKIVRDVSKKS